MKDRDRSRTRRTNIVQLERFVPEAGAQPFPGYKLVRLRGRGAFATVWEATTPTGESIALKFMSSSNAGSTAREIHSLQGIQKVQHPYLLPIQKVWSVPGSIVIGMDLADASMLDLFLLYVEEFQKLLEPEKLILYLAQTALALDHLNARKHQFDGKLVGFQHSDIKLNNILLMGNEARVADYGLATPMMGSSTPCFRQGTLDYAAPEVFQGSMSDASDQFSLAVTYHLLRTGAFPYPTPPTHPSKSYLRPPPDLQLTNFEERQVVSRALSGAPQNRFPTCWAFIEAAAKALGVSVTVDMNQRVTTRQRLLAASTF